VAQGSQTAFLSRMIFDGASAILHPLVFAKIILGDALFSKFVSSNMGQKWLTTGIKFKSPQNVINFANSLKDFINSTMPAIKTGAILQTK